MRWGDNCRRNSNDRWLVARSAGSAFKFMLGRRSATSQLKRVVSQECLTLFASAEGRHLSPFPTDIPFVETSSSITAMLRLATVQLLHQRDDFVGQMVPFAVIQRHIGGGELLDDAMESFVANVVGAGAAPARHVVAQQAWQYVLRPLLGERMNDDEMERDVRG